MKIYQNLRAITKAMHILTGKKHWHKVNEQRIQSQEFEQRRANET